MKTISVDDILYNGPAYIDGQHIQSYATCLGAGCVPTDSSYTPTDQSCQDSGGDFCYINSIDVVAGDYKRVFVKYVPNFSTNVLIYRIGADGTTASAPPTEARLYYNIDLVDSKAEVHFYGPPTLANPAVFNNAINSTAQAENYYHTAEILHDGSAGGTLIDYEVTVATCEFNHSVLTSCGPLDNYQTAIPDPYTYPVTMNQLLRDAAGSDYFYKFELDDGHTRIFYFRIVPKDSESSIKVHTVDANGNEINPCAAPASCSAGSYVVRSMAGIYTDSNPDTVDTSSDTTFTYNGTEVGPNYDGSYWTGTGFSKSAPATFTNISNGAHYIQYRNWLASGFNSLQVATCLGTGCTPAVSDYVDINCENSCTSIVWPYSSYTGQVRNVFFKRVVAFDYSLNVSKNVLELTAGQTGTNNVTVTKISGTTESVFLSIQNSLPAGVSADFVPGNCNPNCSSVLTVTTSASTPTGDHTITIEGNPLAKTKSFTLRVNPPNVPVGTFSCRPYTTQNVLITTGTKIKAGTPIVWKAFDDSNNPLAVTWTGTDVTGSVGPSATFSKVYRSGKKQMYATYGGETVTCEYAPLEIVVDPAFEEF
jgi:VCBS repeat-containing protein